MKYQLNTRQTAIIAASMFMGLKILSLPSLLYTYSISHSMLLFFIMMTIDLLALWLIMLLKEKKNNFNFIDFIYKILGKVVGKILLGIILFYFLFKLAYISTEAFFYLKNFAQEDATIFSFMLVYLPIIAAMAYNGLKSIARTSEFFFTPIVIGVLATILISFLPQFFSNTTTIKLVFSTDFAPIFKLSFYFGDFLPILFVLDKIKPSGALTKKTMFYAMTAANILGIIYFLYYKLYQITTPLHRYAVGDIISFTKGLDYTTSVNIISFVTFLCLIFLQGAFYYYICNLIFQRIVENKNKKITIPIIYIFISVTIFLISRYNLSIVSIVQNVLSYWGILLLGIIPIVLVFEILYLEKKYAKYKKYF